jgi:hypothetical protein
VAKDRCRAELLARSIGPPFYCMTIDILYDAYNIKSTNAMLLAEEV